MKRIILFTFLLGFFSSVFAYPPAVGILGTSKNCLSCHVNNGPWKDNGTPIIDIIDKETLESFKRTDGSFLIEDSNHLQ